MADVDNTIDILDQEPTRKNPMTDQEFERLWRDDFCHSWKSLPLDEIFYVSGMDKDNGLCIIDKDNNDFMIQFVAEHI